jgi:hypothetical protein
VVDLSTDYLEFIVKKVPGDPINKIKSFREFAKTRSTKEIEQLLEFCKKNVKQSGVEKYYAYVYQDLVNVLGERLGFNVQYGEYGRGFDGLWIMGEDRILIESKSSSFWLNLSGLNESITSNNAKVGVAVCGDVDPDKIAAIKMNYPKIRLMTITGICNLTKLVESKKFLAKGLGIY